MPDRSILIQYVINQRHERPGGWRLWSDGIVQRVSAENPPPGEVDLLDQDRELTWNDGQPISPPQIEVVKNTIRQSGFFDLEPRLLINYCKEDPGTAIWTVNLDGQIWRVVVYDPRPKRSPTIDKLTQTLAETLEK